MRLRTVFLLPLLLAAVALCGQAGKLSKKHEREMAEAEERMAIMLATVYTDSSEEARFTACRNLVRELVATLNRPNSFNYDFTKLKGMGIQYPEDRSFRIFSWELHVDRDQYRHYGAIQKNAKQLELTPLIDRGDAIERNPETVSLPAGEWLGYTVYNLLEGGTFRGQPYYLLFGYDSYGAYRRRKVLDVLSFDHNGGAVFGLPVFATYNESGLFMPDRTRIILEYGAEAVVALRYDPDFGAIVYENLVLVQGGNDEGPISMPDGSYHSLKPDERGLWREQEKIFTQTYKEAPREAGKPAGGRDLIGREKKPGGGGK